MEDVKPTAPTPEEKPAAPQVNDITAPLPASTSPDAPAPPASDESATAPVSDSEVQPAPAKEDDEQKTEEPKVEEKPKPKVPKQHGSGLAIFAAIVIVLGLGAMFTYAYLQTQ